MLNLQQFRKPNIRKEIVMVVPPFHCCTAFKHPPYHTPEIDAQQ